jgi:hypothetical protein
MTDLSQQNQWAAVLGRECTSENIFSTPQILLVRTPSYGDGAFNSRSDGSYEAQSPQPPIRAKPVFVEAGQSDLPCLSPSHLRIVSDFQLVGRISEA